MPKSDSQTTAETSAIEGENDGLNYWFPLGAIAVFAILLIFVVYLRGDIQNDEKNLARLLDMVGYQQAKINSLQEQIEEIQSKVKP